MGGKLAEGLVNVTDGCGVIVVPVMATETVLASAVVERSVAVVWPLLSVGVVGCASALPVPVAETTTLAAGMPVIGLLAPSLAVMVIVAVAAPSAARLSGLTATVEFAALTVLQETAAEALLRGLHAARAKSVALLSVSWQPVFLRWEDWVAVLIEAAAPPSLQVALPKPTKSRLDYRH